MEKTSTSSAGLSPSLETLNPKVATVDDIDHIISLGRDFLAYSPYRDVELDEAAVRAMLEQIISSGLGVCFFHERGFILGVLTPLFFAPDVKMATELAWWAPDAGGTELREVFEHWAKLSGAAGVQMSTLNNGFAARLAGNLTDNGYTPVEVAYMKAI